MSFHISNSTDEMRGNLNLVRTSGVGWNKYKALWLIFRRFQVLISTSIRQRLRSCTLFLIYISLIIMPFCNV